MKKYITPEEMRVVREGTIEDAVNVISEVCSRIHNMAVEDAINKAPDVMLQLFMTQQAQEKLKAAFYERNPDFRNYMDIVRATVFDVEQSNPDKTYDYILTLSEPLIRGRISRLKEIRAISISDGGEFNNDGSTIL